ncbi:hypothetical protein IMY05_C5089000700 [Salix suchowensis]|nr:hypothetical protein IMY05_C5089000700 [Salix suchowensis]
MGRAGQCEHINLKECNAGVSFQREIERVRPHYFTGFRLFDLKVIEVRSSICNTNSGLDQEVPFARTTNRYNK